METSVHRDVDAPYVISIVFDLLLDSHIYRNRIVSGSYDFDDVDWDRIVSWTLNSPISCNQKINPNVKSEQK